VRRATICAAGILAAVFLANCGGGHDVSSVKVPKSDDSAPRMSLELFVGPGANQEAASLSSGGAVQIVRIRGEDHVRLVGSAADPESGVQRVRIHVVYSVECSDAVSSLGVSRADTRLESVTGSNVIVVHKPGETMPVSGGTTLRTAVAELGQACGASPSHPLTFNSLRADVSADAANALGQSVGVGTLRLEYAPRLRIATYNIALGGVWDPQLDAAADRLRNADVAFVQEIDDRQWLLGGHQNEPSELATKAGLTDYSWAGSVNFNAGTVWGRRGPAILSRFPLANKKNYFLPPFGTSWTTDSIPTPRTAVVTATVEVDGVSYLLIASHFPFDREQDRAAAAVFVRDLMVRHDGPAIFGADVNGNDLPIAGTSIVNAYDVAPAVLVTVDSSHDDRHCGVPDPPGSGNDQIYLKTALAVISFDIRCTSPAVSDHPFVLTRLG
jgi:endonuclease/exonuclease/phosphatase family metal-dependent hydrolase